MSFQRGTSDGCERMKDASLQMKGTSIRQLEGLLWSGSVEELEEDSGGIVVVETSMVQQVE